MERSRGLAPEREKRVSATREIGMVAKNQHFLKGTAYRKLVMTASLWMAVLPTAASTTAFTPHLSVERTYNSNVLVVEEDGEGTSAVANRFRVNLDATHVWADSTLAVGYHFSHTKYDDLEVLDFSDHRLLVDFGWKPGRDSLALRASYVRTQEQGLPDTELSLSQVATRDQAHAVMEYSKVFGDQWASHASIGASDVTYEEIGLFQAPGDSLDPQDRRSYSGRLGFARTFSRRNSMGLYYKRQLFKLDDPYDEAVDHVFVSLKHLPHRKASITFELGAFKRSADVSAEEPVEPDIVEYGVTGRVTYALEYEWTTFSVGVIHAPASGGSLRGTSTNSELAASLTRRLRRDWDWLVFARYERRDPSERSLPVRDAYGFGGWLERHIGQKLGLRLQGKYVKQSSADLTEPGASFREVRLGLVWYPFTASGKVRKT